MEWKSGVALAVSAALSAGSVLAAEPGDEATELDRVVVVASKVERPLREVAGIVDTIGMPEIEDRMARDIDDLLRFEPGISMQRDPGRFGNSTFSIRGVGGNRVVTEVDGIPVQDGFLIGDFSNAGRDLVDPGIVRKVEILRGPASALYGSDALGGVISFTTMDPHDLYSGDEAHVAARIGYGGADDSQHAAAYYATGGDIFDVLATVNRHEGSELEAKGADENPADYRNTGALVKLVRYGDTGDAMRLALDLDDGDRQTNVQSLVQGPGRYATTTRLEGDDKSQRARASLSGDVSSASWLADEVTWHVFYQESDTVQDTVQELEASSRTPYPTRRERRFEYSQRAHGGEVTAEALLATSVEQRLVYGLELTQTHTLELRDATLTNLDTGDTTNTLLGETFPVRDFPKTDTLEAGLYVQDEILFDAWTLIPALRYEYYKLDPQPDAIYQQDNPDTMPVALSESEVTPRLGVIRQLGTDDSLYVQYTRGFRAPPFEDVNIGLDIPLFGIRAIPNPDLEPERSDGIELGWRHDDGLLAIEAGLFYTEFDNLIESRAPLGFDPATGLLLFQSVNREEARIHGVEIRSLWRAGRQFGALDGLEFEAAASVTRGVDTARDEWLNSIDPDSLILAGRYERPHWGLELVWTLVAPKERVDETSGQLFRPAGYGLLDAFASWRPGGGWTLRAGVDNVTDRRYWRWSDVQGLAANDPLVPLYARPGRNLRLEIKKVF